MINLLKQKNCKKIVSEELIFVLWFWEFALLRYFIIENKDKSTLILFSGALILLILSLFKGVKFSNFLVFIIIFYIYGFFKYIFTNEASYLVVLEDFLYKFVINGVLPVYFFTQIKDAKKVLKLLIFFSVIVFFIFFKDPFNGYILTGNYMGFGFLVALPVYFCLNIGRKYFRYNYLLLLEIATIILIFGFSNRSAILSFLVFNFLNFVFIEKIGYKKKIIEITIVIIAFIIAMFLFKYIINFIFIKMEQQNLHIRVVGTVYNYFYGSHALDTLSSGRISIWENAIKIIKKNIFFGSGLKFFESIYVYYSHNIVLDLLIQFGVFIFLGFTYLCIKSFFNIIHYNYYEKILGIMFFSLWFPKLLFSSSMYYDHGLWMFLAFGLSGLKKYKFKFLK